MLPIHLSQGTGERRHVFFFSMILAYQLKEDDSEVSPNVVGEKKHLFRYLHTILGQKFATSPGKLFATHH